MSDVEHKIIFRPPYDCIKIRPCSLGSDRCYSDSNRNHGMGAALYHFMAVYEKHAVDLEYRTGLYLPESFIAMDRKIRDVLTNSNRIAHAELFFHYPYARYDGASEPGSTTCEYTGGDCWPDSGALWGQDVWDSIVATNIPEDVLWPELDKIVKDMVKNHILEG